MSALPQAAAQQGMTITGIVRLAREIFPEISAHAWEVRQTPDGIHWILQADFDRSLRLEIILNQNEWAVCQIVTRLDPFARTVEEAERVVIKPLKDDFIGWLSSVRAIFPLPHSYMVVKTFNHSWGVYSCEIRAGSLFAVDKDYATIRFSDESGTADVTPDKLREWLAKGYVVRCYDYADPCRGCAAEFINCGSKEKRDPNKTRSCYHLHNVPKAQQPDHPTDLPKPPPKAAAKQPTLANDWKPLQATGETRNVPCGRCQHGTRVEASDGDWDWQCQRGHYPSRDCEDFKTKAEKASPGPKPSCPQCVHFDAQVPGCRLNWVIGNPVSCADFKWAGIAPTGGTGLRATRPSERNCKNCENYGGPGTCKVDEALGTAPICNLYSQKTPTKVWPKCTTCKHLKDDGDCHINVNMTGYEDCDFYEDKPAEGSTRKSVQCPACDYGISSKSKSGVWSWKCQAGENPENPSPCPRHRIPGSGRR